MFYQTLFAMQNPQASLGKNFWELLEHNRFFNKNSSACAESRTMFYQTLFSLLKPKAFLGENFLELLKSNEIFNQQLFYDLKNSTEVNQNNFVNVEKSVAYKYENKKYPDNMKAYMLTDKKTDRKTGNGMFTV